MKSPSLMAVVLPACLLFASATLAQSTTPQAAPAAQATPATPAAQAAPPTPRPAQSGQSWLVEFDRTAKSNGTVVFRVWPWRADPIDISIPVSAGDTENAIAIRFKEAARAALSNDEFRVNMAEKFVRIAAIHGERRFALEPVVANVEGLQIDYSLE